MASIHEGHTLEEVPGDTGFDFDRPETNPTTEPPPAKGLAVMRSLIAPKIADAYPKFAAEMWGYTPSESAPA